MTLGQYRQNLIKLIHKETDSRVKDMLLDLYLELPMYSDMKDVPCKIGKKPGYFFKCWIRDDIRPWDNTCEPIKKTYALVYDGKTNRCMKVKPEKIVFDKEEAERWEDLHG